MKPLVEATLYRDAGAVRRYHVQRTLRQQTIAEHTFGMLMLIKQVRAGTFISPALYDAVLHHDLPELFTGDMPAPIKRAHPDLGPLMDSIEEGLAPLYLEPDLDAEDTALLKWADRMELVLWCLEEIKMGNTHCHAMVKRGLGWILNSVIPPCAVDLTAGVVEAAQQMGLSADTGAKLEMMA